MRGRRADRISPRIMDTVTQFVIGAAAGQLVGGRALGRTAALVGGLAGWLPDADVLIRSAADPLLAIEQHRGFTHALLFTPVGAALAAAPFLLRREWRAKAGAVYAAALAGWATHAPLDACTSYGTQLLWPFSDLRVAWNVVSIVDPVITLPLILGVVLAAWLRRTWPAAAALAVALAWLGVGALQHARAAGAQQALADARGHEVVRARVDPSLGNMVLWRSLYQTPDGRLHADAVRLPLAGGNVTVRHGASTPAVRTEEIALVAGSRSRRGGSGRSRVVLVHRRMGRAAPRRRGGAGGSPLRRRSSRAGAALGHDPAARGFRGAGQPLQSAPRRTRDDRPVARGGRPGPEARAHPGGRAPARRGRSRRGPRAGCRGAWRLAVRDPDNRSPDLRRRRLHGPHR